jgi:hypothetical protein
MLNALQGAPRVAEKVTIHGTVEFLSLCEQVITPETKYLVLDLDRTIHFGHNVGELLGWELSAFQGYGPAYLQYREQRTDRKRFFALWKKPLGLFRYLAVAGGRWWIPGLYYLFFVKIAARVPLLRRWVFRRFGLEPVDTVQSVMRNILLAQLSAVPLEVARDLVRGLWRRLEPDQVVSREDLEALRARFPALKIVVSSASPQPVLEVAREELGLDAVLYTEVEEHEGFLSIPHEIGCLEESARRISPPSLTKHNAAARKIDRLVKFFDDFSDPKVEKVGITDTSYGEDHVWAHYFTKVVDINSPSPFSPIVTMQSPLKEVHSAFVLTHEEKRRRAGGEGDYLDPRRKPDWETPATFEGRELQEYLKRPLEGLAGLNEVFRRHAEAVTRAKAELSEKLNLVMQEIEQEVDMYNRSLGAARKEAQSRLRAAVEATRKLRKSIADAERPLSETAFQTAMLLEESRRELSTQLLRLAAPNRKRKAA